MREEENIALAKQGFDATMRRDYDALRPLLTEDVVWSGPLQPETHGADELITSMKQQDQLGFTWEHEYEGVWADENRVVMLHHMKLTRDGRTLDTHPVQVIEIRDGKAAKITMYTSEPEKMSELMT